MGKLKNTVGIHQEENFIILRCSDENKAFDICVKILLKIAKNENIALLSENSNTDVLDPFLDLLDGQH